MTTYTSICTRCLGTGRFDRGTCFRCNGAKVLTTTKKPVRVFEASAIFKDGVRRIVVKRSTMKSALEAGAASMRKGGSEFWDMDSLEVKELV